MLTGPLLYYVVVGTIVSASPMKSRGLIYGDWEWGWLHIAFFLPCFFSGYYYGYYYEGFCYSVYAEVNSVDRV